ncbi:Crp/Fnr family transcriptional regulator [soil metagenome]
MKQRSLEEMADLLSSVGVFESLSEQQVWDLARRTPYVHLVRGQILHTPGHRGRTLFLLLEGRIRSYEISDAREFTLGVIKPGEFFGEMALSVERIQRTYSQSVEPSTVAFIGRDALRRLVIAEPEVGLGMIDQLAERLSWYAGRLVDFGHKEVQARLAALIVHLVDREGVESEFGITIPTHYTHGELGTVIGANREAVTNALIGLRKSGAVEIRGRQIYVRNVDALRRIDKG